jgi:hypothetical protein
MFLQSAKQLYGADAVTPEAVVEIAGVLPQDDAERLWRSIREPRFDDIRGVVSCDTVVGCRPERVVSCCGPYPLRR